MTKTHMNNVKDNEKCQKKEPPKNDENCNKQ
jgi:hypothetical protein